MRILVEICVGNASEYGWRGAAAHIIGNLRIEDSVVLLSVSGIGISTIFVKFGFHRTVEISSCRKINELFRILLAGNLDYIENSSCARASHIALLGLAVGRDLLEGATGIHSTEFVLRREAPLAPPPFCVGHIILGLLDGTAERGDIVFVVEVVVESIALVACQSIVVLGKGSSPTVVVTSGIRITASGPRSAVSGIRFIRVFLVNRLTEIVFGPIDGMSQIDYFTFPFL